MAERTAGSVPPAARPRGPVRHGPARLDLMLRDHHRALRCEEAEVTVGSALIGKTLADLDLHNRVGLAIIAVRRGPKGQFVYNPAASTRVGAGDALIVCGEPPKIEALRDMWAGR